MWRKIALFIIGPLVTISLTAFKFGPFVSQLEERYPDHKKAIENSIGLSLVALALANFGITVLAPEKKLQKAYEAKQGYLRVCASEELNLYEKQGFKLFLNLTRPSRYYFRTFRLKPNKKGEGKTTLFPKIFRCVWTYPEKYDLPSDFMLGVEQGASGIAYKTKETFSINIEDSSSQQLREILFWNENQIAITRRQKVTFLISTPVMVKVTKSGNEVPKIIGTLTMICFTPNAGHIIDEQDEQSKLLKASFVRILEKLARDFSKLHF